MLFRCGIKPLIASALVVTQTLLFITRARAADPPDPNPATEMGRLTADVNRLKQDLRDQRQLILQLMQMDQQRYDVLLRYLQSGSTAGGPGPDGLPGLPVPPSLSGGTPSMNSSPTAASGGKQGGTSSSPGRESAAIFGRVRVSGSPPGEMYVYLDGPKAAPVRNHTVEIKQKDKQFSPRVTVVAVGTRIVFPNVDTVIHNVFSTTPGNAFDLGSVKNGERTSPVTLLKTGHVEIFCNVHSKMRADVLVVPNAHWTRVAGDGSFQISNVPLGLRRVIVWGPNIKPASQEVDLTSKGAGGITLAAEATTGRPHMNKRGQAYGSYDE